ASAQAAIAGAGVRRGQPCPNDQVAATAGASILDGGGDRFADGEDAIMARKVTIPAVALAAAAFGIALGALAQPTAIDNAMFFHSDVRDDDACRGLRFDPETESYVWPDGVGNPAITCPDAFGWTQFTDAIRYGFWANWSFDAFIW